MDPFQRAVAALANSVLGRDAVYQFKDGGPEFPVRLILSRPEDNLGGVSFGGPGKAAVKVEATITADSFVSGRPSRNDLIGIGSERGYRVETVRQDAEGVSYVLGLSRQD